VDIGLGIEFVQVEHLGYDQIGTIVVYFAKHEDHTLFQQATVQVNDPFLLAATFKDKRNLRHGTPLQPAPESDSSSVTGSGKLQEIVS
jgi:hypothetical protein